MDRMEARTLIDETIRREVGRVIEQEVGRALRVMGMPVADVREERPLLGRDDGPALAEAREIAARTLRAQVPRVSDGDPTGYARHCELMWVPGLNDYAPVSRRR